MVSLGYNGLWKIDGMRLPMAIMVSGNQFEMTGG